MNDVASMTEEEVAGYLKQHPDFFLSKSALLEELRLTHPVRGSVSLIERQLQQMRDRNLRLRAQLSELVSNARDNERLTAALFDLAVAIARAEGAHAKLAEIEATLTQKFATDVVHLRLCQLGIANGLPRFVSVAPNGDAFAAQIAGQAPICGTELAARIATEACLDKLGVASWAVLPIVANEPVGALILGSMDAKRFTPELRTDLLARLADIVGSLLVYPLL